MKFEQAMGELEKVVKQLESGEPDLEEALALFEQGVKLAGICNGHLEKAEVKVKQLVDGGQGTQPLEVCDKEVAE